MRLPKIPFVPEGGIVPRGLGWHYHRTEKNGKGWRDFAVFYGLEEGFYALTIRIHGAKPKVSIWTPQNRHL